MRFKQIPSLKLSLLPSSEEPNITEYNKTRKTAYPTISNKYRQECPISSDAVSYAFLPAD